MNRKGHELQLRVYMRPSTLLFVGYVFKKDKDIPNVRIYIYIIYIYICQTEFQTKCQIECRNYARKHVRLCVRSTVRQSGGIYVT